MIGGLGHEDYASYFGDVGDRSTSYYTSASKPSTSYHCSSADPSLYYNYCLRDPAVGPRHYESSRYLVGDVLTEETLMKDITRGLREIVKTPSEDSGVELGSNYGLFAPRDAHKHLHDRKRLRSRVMENDPYLRENLDLTLGPYSFDETECSGYSYRGEMSGRPYRESEDICPSRGRPLDREERLHLLQPQQHRQLPARHLLDDSALPPEALLRRSEASLHHRIYEPENTPHLSKEEFLTKQVHTTNANL